MMKFRGSILFSVCAVIFLVAAYWPPVNNAEKEAVLMQTILGGLKQLHYQPQDIDDDFSAQAFDLYLDRLDSGRRWLTEADVKQMEPFKNEIDDQIYSSNYKFFDLSVQLLEAGMTKTRGYYKDILAQPFDYKKDETIELDGDKKGFAKNDKELKENWRKSLKYNVMSRLANKIEKQKESLEKIAKGEEVEDFEEKTFEQMEEKVRQDVIKQYDDYFKRLDKERRSDRLSYYLNAITNIYDPHTSYYEPKDKENFDINMSGSLEGIGARLQTDDELTKIVSIVPGGPAWKGGELEVNDKIMKVAQGDDEPIDINGWRIDDVVKKIRGKKGTVVNLTVKKVDGSTEVISITRDIVILDEGYAKSVILDFEGVASNIGYIKLPRFYADFQGTTGRSCADDIEKEIEKLKSQNVEGIILDLRNNGGGSLRDVVRMSGLFIEEGPIVQVKARDRSPEVLEDEDDSVQYKGHLIVMVNEFSASASEILAAALQDYDRALIVGSNSTFGKGTVQRFFDLDRAIRGNSEIKPLGQVKMTIQKFYRVNGGSTQLKGVTPDIILPDNYTYIKTGEQDQEYAMKWTEIDPVEYNQKVTSVQTMLPTLKRNSSERVSNSEVFQMIDANAKRLKEQRDITSYSLNLEEYQAMEAKLDKEAEKYEEIFQTNEELRIENLLVDLKDIQIDESKKARNDEWLESIQEDPYIEECLHIMQDMLQMK